METRWDMGLMMDSDARGHYTVGKELIDQVLDKIRRVAGTSSELVVWYAIRC